MSNAIIDQQLQLTFVALTEAQMLSIHTHYINRQGRYLSFAIPDSLLSGMLAPASFTPIASSWLYAGSPKVEDVPGLSRYTVSVELVNAPPENATARGSAFTIVTSFEGGEATTGPDVTPGTTTLEFDPPLETDGGFDVIELLVTGVEGFVTTVEVTVSFTKLAPPGDPFTYNHEARFYLSPPGDDPLLILSTFQVGVDGVSDSAIITFGDAYSAYPDDSTYNQPYASGSFAPFNAFSELTGTAMANGTWNFYYADDSADGGPLQIHSVSITVT
jgi:hypothetical protein